MSDSADGFLRVVVMVSLAVLAATAPLAWWLGGLTTTIGCVGGALLGLANLFAMTWLVRRLVFGTGSNHSKGFLGVLLASKLVAFAVIAWLAVQVLGLDIIGFTLGFSAVVLGMFAGGFHAALGELDEHGLEEHES
ncbi:MAG: hypothetical protein ACI9WU_000555 [Myxococcota bacterium]|jgi:hypothetical protein